MKGTIKGKVYLGLMMLFAMTLWLAGRAITEIRHLAAEVDLLWTAFSIRF